jgi:hypothetical protein
LDRAFPQKIRAKAGEARRRFRSQNSLCDHRSAPSADVRSARPIAASTEQRRGPGLPRAARHSRTR